MLSFSGDPQVADRQMQAIIFYLTTFGYIDGEFDNSEKEFVRTYIQKLVEHRVQVGMPSGDAKLQTELVQRFTTHFHEVFENIDRHVADLFTEAVAQDEDQDAFIHAKLKLRCFELFQEFERDNQEALMAAMDDLIAADGEVHPAEQKFRNELVDLFETDVDIDVIEDSGGGRRTIVDPIERRQSSADHPFFQPLEFLYSTDNEQIQKQIH